RPGRTIGGECGQQRLHELMGKFANTTAVPQSGTIVDQNSHVGEGSIARSMNGTVPGSGFSVHGSRSGFVVLGSFWVLRSGFGFGVRGSVPDSGFRVGIEPRSLEPGTGEP